MIYLTEEQAQQIEEALDELRYANNTDIAKTKYYKALSTIRAARAQEQAEQGPVAYLCDGSRYKVLGEDRSGYGRILGLPESLAGQWVALVDATDGKHLRAEPARTKDLTDDEIHKCMNGNFYNALDFARAVIAADREKNRG